VASFALFFLSLLRVIRVLTQSLCIIRLERTKFFWHVTETIKQSKLAGLLKKGNRLFGHVSFRNPGAGAKQVQWLCRLLNIFPRHIFTSSYWDPEWSSPWLHELLNFEQ